MWCLFSKRAKAQLTKPLNKGHKTAGCAPSSQILACYFVPFTASVMYFLGFEYENN